MIGLRNISVEFDGKEVLKDFSADFEEGVTTCISGPSGAGKTTLLRVVSGLQKPDAGEITGVPEKLGFVFQEDRLFPDFSGISNIRAVTGKKVPEEEILQHFEELGLLESAGLPVKDYSGGMKRRVALIRAILWNPDLLLLDEPFKGLDPEMKERTMDYVKKHTAGKTVLLVTHDLQEAAYLGGERLVLGA